MVVLKKQTSPHLPVYNFKRTKTERSSFRLATKTVRPKELKKNEGWKKIAKEKSLDRNLNDPSDFKPEIQLKNRIIDQLTHEYQGKLKPISKKKTSKSSQRDKSPEYLQKSKKSGVGNPGFAFSPSENDGFTNQAFADSPDLLKDSVISGLANPGFEASPLETGVSNPGYEESPLQGGLQNDGFLDSPDLDIKYQPDMRHWAEVTPRKARVDRHQQRWLSEELQTLYEELPSFNEKIPDKDTCEEYLEKVDRKVSLAEFLPMEKQGRKVSFATDKSPVELRSGAKATGGKLFRVGSVKNKKDKDSKLRRVSSAILGTKQGI